MSFKDAIQKEVSNIHSVDVEIGDEIFEWMVNGASLVKARKEGIEIFDLFADISTSKESKVTLSVEALYHLLWIGFIHLGVEIEDVQKLPVSKLKELPVEDLMKSLSNSEMGKKG